MPDGPFNVINREGNYYVLDMETKLRVSPPLPNARLAMEFQKIAEQFGPPSNTELLDPSFDWRGWMMRVSSDMEDDVDESEYTYQDYMAGGTPPKSGGGSSGGSVLPPGGGEE